MGTTNKPPRPPPPKPLRLPSRSKPRSKWAPSANPDTTDMVDTDTEDTDTTTARRSLKPPPTTCPLSPPSRPVSTNPSTYPLSAAKTSLKNVPSPFPPSKTPPSLLPSAPLDSENPPAKRSSSPSPNKSVSNLSTDTPMSPHPLPPLMPPLLRNKNLANIDHQNLCRSIAQE